MPGDPQLAAAGAVREAGLRPDPGRRGQGVRSVAGEGRAAGALRPQHLRAVLPDGAAAGRARRALRHHQLQGLGHAQAALSRPCAASCRRWTRAWRRCCRTCPTAACWTAPSSGGAASSAGRPRSSGKPPWNGGRGHYGKVFSAVVAGGGFKGGRVVGASDAKGEEVKERPVYPCDLIGSMYELLGIDPDAKLPHPAGPGGPRDAHGRGRRDHGRTPEGNHVTQTVSRRIH